MRANDELDELEPEPEATELGRVERLEGIDRPRGEARALVDDHEDEGAVFDALYHNPHVPQGKGRTAVEHPDRKPGPGMLLTAASELHLNLAASWMVGDFVSDVLAGHHAGCQGNVDRDNRVTLTIDDIRGDDEASLAPLLLGVSLVGDRSRLHEGADALFAPLPSSPPQNGLELAPGARMIESSQPQPAAGPRELVAAALHRLCPASA